MAILHLITGLTGGGAERFLLNLVKERRIQKTIVVSLKSGGELRQSFIDSGVIVFEMDCGSLRRLILSLIKIRQLIKSEGVRTLVSWMYHANLVGALVKTPQCKLIWNVRGPLDQKLTKRSTYIIAIIL